MSWTEDRGNGGRQGRGEAPTAEPARPERGGRKRSALGVIFLTLFLDLLGFGLILPLLPFYALEFDASPLEVTLLSSCFSLAQLLFNPIWGRLSDRFGRRPLLLVSILLNLVGYLIFAWAPTLLILFAARTASGIASANFGIAQAYIADVTAPEERAKGMGLVGAAFGLGFVFGPALGGWLSQISYQAVPLAAAALAALNLVSAFFLLPESLSAEDRKDAGGRRWVDLSALRGEGGPASSQLSLMILLFLVIGCFAMMEATLPLFFEARLGFGVLETSYFFIFVGAVMVFVQVVLLGRAVARLGEQRLIWVGILLMSGGLLLVPVTASLLPAAADLLAMAPERLALPAMALCGLLLALGAGLHNPSITSTISRLTGREEQGGTLGLSRSFGALGRVCGPALGGWLFGRLGAGWPFWVSGGLMLCALAGALALLRRLPPLPSSS